MILADYEMNRDDLFGRNDLSDLMYRLGFICLILAPFTGITIVGAAAFFVIAWIIDHA